MNFSQITNKATWWAVGSVVVIWLGDPSLYFLVGAAVVLLVWVGVYLQGLAIKLQGEHSFIEDIWNEITQ